MQGKRMKEGKILLILYIMTTLQLCRTIELSDGQQFPLREYCSNEVFNPKCQPDEVVVITSARYGHMNVSRCLRENYGSVGCNTSVRPYLDSKCSGQRTCNLPVTDLQVDSQDANACLRDLTPVPYLEASYACVKVENTSCHMCQSMTHAVVTQDKGYLATVVSKESQMGCGTVRCPWRIEVLPGQRVNLTLLDFGTVPSQSMGIVCFRYAIVKEKESSDIPICRSNKREVNVYLSKTNVVEIIMVNPELISEIGQFMLHFEAVGCPRLDTPENSEVRQEGDDLIYRCLGSNESWSMHCNDTVWEGQMQTCADTTFATTPHLDQSTSGLEPLNLCWSVLFALLFLALVACNY